MSVPSVVTGIYWHHNTPRLYSFDENGNETDHPLPIGNQLTLATTDTRYCIGFYDAESRSACQNKQTVQTYGPPQCVRCASQDTSWAARTGLASTEQDKAFLQLPHVVYLALFGDDPIPKVGVSRRDRIVERIHEQGAWGASVLAEVNGNQARILEQEIQRSLNFPQRVSLEHKLLKLLQTINETTARQSLAIACQRIQNNFLDLAIAPPNLIFAYPDYGLERSHISTDIELINRIESNFRISGRLVGILGQVAIVRSGQHTYALPGKLLAGHQVETFTTSATSDEEAHGFSHKSISIDTQGRLF